MLFPALVLLTPLHPVQSVTHTETTVGNDTAVHARPATWQPLQQDFISAIGAGVEIDYDVTFTNQQSSPLTFSSMRGFGASFVNGGHYNGGAPCWGIDYFQDDFYYILQLPAPVTIDPGQSQRLTGTGLIPGVGWSGAPYAGSFCIEDGLHSSSNLRIWPPVGRPVPAWRVGAGSNTTLGVDHGSVVVANDMSIQTRYVLPPTGSQGCVATNQNSTGAPGAIEAFGVAYAAPGDSLLTLRSTDLPPGAFALPLVGTVGQAPTALGSGQGVLCISGVSRWGAGIGTVSASGTLSTPVDSASLNPVVGTVTPGTTLHFQLWHRDFDQGQPTSNTTGSTLVLFQ